MKQEDIKAAAYEFMTALEDAIADGSAASAAQSAQPLVIRVTVDPNRLQR